MLLKISDVGPFSRRTDRQTLRVLAGACLLSLVAARTYTQSPSAPSASPLVERIVDTGFVQLQAPSFGHLAARQQALA